MTSDKLEEIFSDIDAGAEFWRKFQKEYRICSKDVVIIMASKRQDFNYYTLHYLNALREEKKIDSIYVLHTSTLSKEYIKKEATTFIYEMECSDIDINNLCRLAYIYKFSEQVIINTYENICDCDGSLLIDGVNRTVEDIIAISILGLSSIPKDCDCDKEEVVGEKFLRIDWEETEQKIKTGTRYDTTNESMELMIRQNTKQLIEEKKIEKEDKIVLFGLNKSSMMIKSILQGYNIAAIIDNDKRKVGRVIDGINVYAPEDYLKEYDASKKIIVASKYYHSMCEQLYQFGYGVGKEIFVVYYKEHFYDVLPETINHYKDRIQIGEEIYWNIRKNMTEGSIFLCPYPGTGDIYIIGLYLEQYRKENDISDYVLVVCTNACKKVADLFGLKTVQISETEIQAVIAYARVVGMEEASVCVLNDSFGEQNAIARLRGYKKIDFCTMFTECILKLEKKTVYAEFIQNNSDELFEKYNLVKGKTVLLSPYANTVNNLSDSFWMKIAEILIGEGYQVCTNVASSKEEPVRGTIGIFIPYKMIVDFLDKAGFFIGLRSGLCDIVSSTSAKMFILYPRGMMFGSGTLYDYFSLSNMGLRKEKLLELEYDLEDMDDTADIIINNILSGGKTA